MMKILTAICLLLLALASVACAQEQPGIKQQADNAYDRYEYYKSLNLYLQIADKNKVDIQVVERIADCYRNMNMYTDAETWYEKALADPGAGKTDHFYYAEILLREGKFDRAKEQYKLYYDNDPDELSFKLKDCDLATLWMGQRSGYKVENYKNMNSAVSDWGMTYDGTDRLIFTSDRITDKNVDNRTGNNWFKLYGYDIKTDNLRQLELTSAIKDNFNGNYHIGPIALNDSANTAYITLTTEISKDKLALDKKNWKSNQNLYSRRLQLVIAKKINEHWVIIGNFPYNNIQKYSVSSASLSTDGRILYFASDMPGGEGKTDLWYCEKQGDTWGPPINCGKAINTKDDDNFPNIAPGGTLYYASKGLPGMGGYDIYSAKGEKSNWSMPKNLKYPVNTTSDDFYFVTRDGLSGYLSSNRDGGAGSDDIYKFTFNPADAVNTTTPIAKNTPDANTPGAGIQNTPGTNTAISTGNTAQPFVFEPIYYDLDRYDIRPDAAEILDRLIAYLNRYPALKIKLSSYTDSRASGDYNITLSERRANAVVKYLTERGIAPGRLVARWYGKTNLVNDCGDSIPCTEAEHQLNRRTEFEAIVFDK